ncbi:MAG: hypothetical protein AAF487_00145 [Bacteroidota bacterium]
MNNGIAGLRKFYGIGRNRFGNNWSMNWGAVRARWEKLGYVAVEDMHHWLISQALMKRYLFLKPIGNQSWNLTRFSSHASHRIWAHGGNYMGTSIGGTEFLYPFTSTPNWFNFGLVPYTAGRLTNSNSFRPEEHE